MKKEKKLLTLLDFLMTLMNHAGNATRLQSDRVSFSIQSQKSDFVRQHVFGFIKIIIV